jgi:DNA-binding MarR family transcriptional regulator
MTSPRQAKDALLRQAWSLMFDYLISTGPARQRSLARRALTPNDARALWTLDLETGRPIGTLAREWGCDPSNVTFIVDRLVKAGLVERRESETDRRVKLVRLTALGASTKQALLEEHRTPPESLAQLDRSDLEQLIRIMEKVRAAREAAQE